LGQIEVAPLKQVGYEFTRVVLIQEAPEHRCGVPKV